MHHDPAGQERDLLLAAPSLEPVQNRGLGPWSVVACSAKDILQHDPQDMRQPFEAAAGRCRKIDDPMLPPIDGKGRHSSSQSGIMGHDSKNCITEDINASCFCISISEYAKRPTPASLAKSRTSNGDIVAGTPIKIPTPADFQGGRRQVIRKLRTGSSDACPHAGRRERSRYRAGPSTAPTSRPSSNAASAFRRSTSGLV